jgi:hypothetical protein
MNSILISTEGEFVTELGVTGAVTQVFAALRAVLERESSKVAVSGSISSCVNHVFEPNLV